MLLTCRVPAARPPLARRSPTSNSSSNSCAATLAGQAPNVLGAALNQSGVFHQIEAVFESHHFAEVFELCPQAFDNERLTHKKDELVTITVARLALTVWVNVNWDMPFKIAVDLLLRNMGLHPCVFGSVDRSRWIGQLTSIASNLRNHPRKCEGTIWIRCALQRSNTPRTHTALQTNFVRVRPASCACGASASSPVRPRFERTACTVTSC